MEFMKTMTTGIIQIRLSTLIQALIQAPTQIPILKLFHTIPAQSPTPMATPTLIYIQTTTLASTPLLPPTHRQTTIPTVR